MAAVHFSPDISPSFWEAGSQLTHPQKRSSDKPLLSPLQLPQHPTTHLGEKKSMPRTCCPFEEGGRRKERAPLSFSPSPLETEGWVGTLRSPHPLLILCFVSNRFSLKNHERGGLKPSEVRSLPACTPASLPWSSQTRLVQSGPQPL